MSDIKKAASILRGLRAEAQIIDEFPLEDEELCTLEHMSEIWKALVTKKYIQKGTRNNKTISRCKGVR